jgi:hypothetical protein
MGDSPSQTEFLLIMKINAAILPELSDKTIQGNQGEG